MLGPFQLLRRIDSDFVNLSPIIAYSGTAGLTSSAAATDNTNDSGNTKLDTGNSISTSTNPSSPTASSSPLNVVTNATVITSGSPEICGTWVTLAAAQAYARDHLAAGTGSESDNARALEVFLSDRLVDKFPSALQDFHRLNAGLRALNQFGKHFASTLMVAGGLGILDCAVKISGGDVANVNGVGEERTGMLRTTIALVQSEDANLPLSKTEQDLFHELCVIPPDWDSKENGPPDQEDEECMAMDEDNTVGPFIPHPHVVEVLQMQHVAMDVDMLALALPPTPSTARPDCASFKPASTALPALPRRSGHAKKSSVSSMSSLSSDSEGMTHSTSTIMPSLTKPKATVDDTALAPAAAGNKEKDRDNRPLRRSKRVADALAAMNVPQAAQPSRASRSRKGGSRNSLS